MKYRTLKILEIAGKAFLILAFAVMWAFVAKQCENKIKDMNIKIEIGK